MKNTSIVEDGQHNTQALKKKKSFPSYTNRAFKLTYEIINKEIRRSTIFSSE